MAYKFNPFTGTFDEVSAGGGSTNPGGSDTQVQFNDGDSFGADSGLTFNKTTNALTVGASTVDGGSAKIYGDIDLDDGGSFSTTVQAVTPTANRTISFPDATGTVALVSGANGTIQYNDAGTLKGNSDFTVDPDWDNPTTTFTALKVNVPDVLQGAADSSLLDLQAGGTSKFMVDKNGQATFLTAIFSGGGVEKANNFFFGAGNDVRLYRDAAQSLAQRNGTNAQTFRLYNTYANGGVDFERLSFNWDTNVFKITSEAGGTGTVRGIQLGSAATEPVALFGATPVVQPTTAVGSATVAGGGGNAVNESTTFNGYTLAQVVQALQNLGILA